MNPSKTGNSICLIEHATLNKEVKIEVGRKVFHQMLLKSKKSKYPKLHQHTL